LESFDDGTKNKIQVQVNQPYELKEGDETIRIKGAPEYNTLNQHKNSVLEDSIASSLQDTMVMNSVPQFDQSQLP